MDFAFGRVVEACVEAARSSDGAVQALAVGGSGSDDRHDEYSDLDLFAFCSDGAVAQTLRCLLKAARSAIDTETFSTGPNLIDGFGICHRVFADGFPRVEIFVSTPSTWSCTPGNELATMIYVSELDGQQWLDRISTCREESASKLKVRYILENCTVHAAKVRKFLARGEKLAAILYVHRLQNAADALLASEQAQVFAPDKYWRTLNRSDRVDAMARSIQPRLDAFSDPRLEFDRVGNVLLTALDRMDDFPERRLAAESLKRILHS